MDIIIVFLIIYGLYQMQIDSIITNNSFKTLKYNKRFFNYLFFIHLLFYIIYLVYSYYNRSDSGMYYLRAKFVEEWFSLFQSGTLFIDFITHPFVIYFHMSYESVMLLFSFFGFEGFLLLYLAAKENISNLPIKFAGFTVLELLFLLPNSHFWSVSIGKGCVMLMGIGLFFYGLSRFNSRFVYLLIGSCIIYMVRMHVLIGILIGVGFGMIFGKVKVSMLFKVLTSVICILGFYYIYNNVVIETGMEFGLDGDSNESVSHLANELGKSNSGVDIGNYNQFFKLFTFLFRPLFFDAPSVIGLFTSIEDIIYIILFINFLYNGIFKIRSLNGYFMICFISFLVVSISLAQISGNLGIAVRQKAQIMPLFFLVYSKFITLRSNIKK